MYDCSKCPGYCCSYPIIAITKSDAERLARHFDLSREAFEKKHLKSSDGYKRTLKRQKDKHYGKICKFFDTKARNCSVYKARPKICREFPAEKRCGYYDFLKFEREHQEDPDFVATTNSD